MHATALPPPPPPHASDHLVRLHGVSWEDYQRLLAIRGDDARPKMSYLNGELELMSPSIYHEGIKTTLARLLEAYAEERNLDLNGYGAWTVTEKPKQAGLEPDECYVLGPHDQHEIRRPHLAIEVVWTSGGIPKLEIYKGLGVGEVWIWQNGRISVFCLRGEDYVQAVRSELLPDLDLDQLGSFLGYTNQTQAVRAYRAALRGA